MEGGEISTSPWKVASLARIGNTQGNETDITFYISHTQS